MKNLGFQLFSGVPCSFLKNLINYAINECEYVAAANEGDAVAIASGAYVGGKKSVVLMQNSGLTNAVSPLTSLTYPFRIPLLGFVSLRGEPGIPDEPQHELMGRITTGLLDLMQVEWQYLSNDLEEAKRQLVQADAHIANNRSFFFVVRKGTFEEEVLRKQQSSIAASCGYTKSLYIHNLEELEAALSDWKQTKGLTFLYMKISKNAKGQLGRPHMKPYEVKERLQRFLKQGFIGQ
ncbi:thiamine pyrophosphate-binding protein [Paenibacillus sp. A3]|uniref:thiamine pyrophosphate-binding protein n=1 Tax=Paenibacillus sp. A3 TaxID=1337054 RepID=UPI001ED997D7|nr:thiamine pyrophosphate-binding protein [Paenibacillus sp. A3]